MASGTNAGTNAYTDAGHTGWVPRIPSFKWQRGPWLAAVKSPRYRPAPPAARRRPEGAGWARRIEEPRPRAPHISPAPRGHEQLWRHVSAPRAYRFPVRGGGPRPGGFR
jgi:hypothetical protein